eukprot:scaffold5213_cov37-Prasinocladus_malaysianus.AAC.2
MLCWVPEFLLVLFRYLMALLPGASAAAAPASGRCTADVYTTNTARHIINCLSGRRVLPLGTGRSTRCQRIVLSDLRRSRVEGVSSTGQQAQRVLCPVSQHSVIFRSSTDDKPLMPCITFTKNICDAGSRTTGILSLNAIFPPASATFWSSEQSDHRVINHP